jgi:hypothetical protein
MLSSEKIGVLELPQGDLYNNLMYFTSIDKETINELKKCFINQMSQLNHCESFILSSELFSGNPLTLYSNQEVVLEIVKNALIGFEIELIVFFRRQDELIQSLHMQMLHQGNKSDINDFFHIPFGKIDYTNFIKGLENVFGDVKMNIYPYDKKILEETGIIDIFNLTIKSKALNKINIENMNIGFSPQGKDLFLSLKGDLTVSEIKRLRFLLQKYFNKGLFSEYNILSYSQKNSFLKKFKISNKVLAERYWSKEFGMNDFSNILNKEIQVSKAEEAIEFRNGVIKVLLNQTIKSTSRRVIKEPSIEELTKFMFKKIKRKVYGHH